MELNGSKKDIKQNKIYQKYYEEFSFLKKSNSEQCLKNNKKKIFSNFKLNLHKLKNENKILECIPNDKEKEKEKAKKKKKEKPIIYLKYKKLGKGAFGECFSVESLEDGKVYAAKIVSKDSLSKEKSKKSIVEEIDVQKKLDSSHVVKVKDCYEDNNNVYIILELCENKSLENLIDKRGHLTEMETRCYMFQLIQGVRYLHNKRIIHRDLKPSNLLLGENMELKIGDFGLIASLNKDSDRRRTYCGTLYFMAPEIYEERKKQENNKETKGYSFEVDIWSMGIIMYNILTGKYPFDGNKDEIEDKILKGNFTFPENIPISQSAKDLIKQILVVNPKKRPNLNQMLFHDFFHVGSFPRFLEVSTLNNPPKESVIKKYVPDANEYGIVDKEVEQKKLYKLIIRDIPEIKYEDIKTYTLDSMPKLEFEYYANFMHESSSGFCFYELNNGLLGIIFKSDEEKYEGVQMILNYENNKFYEIKIDNDSEDEIKGHKIEKCPQNLKEKFQKFYDYCKKYLKKRNDNSTQCNSKQLNNNEYENSFSISTNSNIEFIMDSNENKETGSIIENSDSSKEIENDETKIIYVRELIKEKYALYFILSDGTKQAIFKDKIQILISDEKEMVGYVDKDKKRTVIPIYNILKNANHEFAKRLKYIRKISFSDIKTKMRNKLQNIKMHKKEDKKKDFSIEEKE